MMMKKITSLICGIILCLSLSAQEKTATTNSESSWTDKLKISGYIQAQYQYGEENASLKVGTANENPEDSFNRIGIRRGRIKFSYEEGIASGVFQLDITEKGVGIKDAYLSIKEPWFNAATFKAGVFDRPFGYEISYSSSKRESPERSTIFQTLFPDERDLGGAFILQAPKSSPLHFLRLEAGVFGGNGIKQDSDSRKDFIGHLSANYAFNKNIQMGLGVSYYNGGVYQGTEKVYRMKNQEFIEDNDPNNIGKFAKREYVGLDLQFTAKSVLGKSQIRSEYLWGEQPGTANSSKSPNASALPTGDTFIRSFQGGYVMLVQNIGNYPFAAVLKYDWYDPNTDISGDEAGLNNTSKTDLAQNTFGFGALWNVNKSLLLQAYYEINKNEESINVAEMNEDLKNNVFTLRLQYKF